MTELRARNLSLTKDGLDFYVQRVSSILQEDRMIVEAYQTNTTELEQDIRIFIENLNKVRLEKSIRRKEIDTKQILEAFAKCGPHRLRC
jgi:hypothetical protein